MLILLFSLVACNTDSSDVGDDDMDDDVDDDDSADDDLPAECDEIYSQDLLPTFEIRISEEEWEAIVYQYEHGMEIEDPKTYHPLIEFRYKDETIKDAAIRLRGSPDHWWPDPKMQFNISFKEYNPDGRFHGLRKINLDNAHNDFTYMHDRLASAIFHDLGVPAPCVNNARLIINYEYFGLYVNIEHVDQEFLKRNFGEDDEGNLYKKMSHFKWEKVTNEDDPDTSDIDEFDSDLTIDELEELVDLEEAVLEWAGEAIIPHMDGYFVGSVNYYVYNHPKRGFVFIPWDLDYSFEIGGYDPDLITATVSWGEGKPRHFATVISDPKWYEKYLGAIDSALEAYEPNTLLERIEHYAEQFENAMNEDPNLSFTLEEHHDAVDRLKQHIADRAAFTADWLLCVRSQTDYEHHCLGDTQYYLVKTGCSWHRALENCERFGGTLATPMDESEQSLLAGVIFDCLECDWWIGANDIETEGIWTNPYGTPLTYLPWGPSQPSDDDWIDCVHMSFYYNGAWSDDYCSLPHPSVCILR